MPCGTATFVGTLFVVLGCLRDVHSNSEPRACDVRLRIDAGWVCGRVRLAENGAPYASFRGVPYAKPPLGERRFKELEPPEPWQHLYDATEESAACPQKDFIYSRLPLQVKGMSEDCMYLNLHMPLAAVASCESRAAGLPILVMVHGGGYQAGSGLTDMHGPEYLLRHDVIVITFNYRNNIFGYLSLNTAKIPGNQALRDIITLLRWVRRNARAIGGNPDDVTLLGHSTGANNAHQVSLSKAARGLINKVILMSGTAIPNSFSTSEAHAKSVVNRLLAILKINSTDPDYIHDRLIKEPILNLMSALNIMQLKGDIVMLNLVPVVEKEFPNITRVIDDDALTLMAKGRGREYPLMVGFTTAEFNYFKLQLLATDIVERVKNDATVLVPARLRYTMSQTEQQQFGNEQKKYYFQNGTPTLEECVNSFSDVFFRYPSLLISQWRSLWGAPVYVYQFSYESERSLIKEGLWATYKGVAHVEDLTYVFRINSLMQDYVSYPPKNDDDLMREWMPMMFTNFARCGNPTCAKNESQWPPLTADHFQFQDIAKPMVYKMSNLTQEHKAVMDLYERIDIQLRNVTEALRKKKLGIQYKVDTIV